MYQPRFFRTEELVSKKVYDARGVMALALFDPRALEALDACRTAFGALTVNNWVFGGDRQYSGFRAASEPYHSQYSQHSFGRAFDCVSKTLTAQQMRDFIWEHPDLFPHITFVEEGKDVTWLHFDVRMPIGFIEATRDGIVFWDKNTRTTRITYRR